MHPTKREFHFLEEEGITESIADVVQAKFAQSGEQKFEYQVDSAHWRRRFRRRWQGKGEGARKSADSDTAASTSPPGPPVAKKILSQHKSARLVQTESSTRCFFQLRRNDHCEPAARQDTEVVKEERKTRETQQSTYYLTSITTLGDNVTKGRHTELMDILQKHVFFGVVDPVCELCVVQVSTKLYLVNHGALVEEFLPAQPTSVPQFRKA
ncbi:hypothetical protein BJY52DRAFT_1199953 [Lactarius psammicola]|nr:hypothetical protein BJY52DRAFT_1199953 [Lactarius psammicola]